MNCLSFLNQQQTTKQLMTSGTKSLGLYRIAGLKIHGLSMQESWLSTFKLTSSDRKFFLSLPSSTRFSFHYNFLLSSFYMVVD